MAGDQELMVQPTDFQFDLSDEELLGYYLKRDLYRKEPNDIYKQSSSAFGTNKRTLAESINDADLVRGYTKKQRWEHCQNFDASNFKGDVGEGATEGQQSFPEPPPNQLSSSDDENTTESELTDEASLEDPGSIFYLDDNGLDWESLFELVGLWSRDLFFWMN